jgi:hypothetical protein
MNLPGADGKIHAVQRGNAREALGQPSNLEQRGIGHGFGG